MRIIAITFMVLVSGSALAASQPSAYYCEVAPIESGDVLEPTTISIALMPEGIGTDLTMLHGENTNFVVHKTYRRDTSTGVEYLEVDLTSEPENHWWITLKGPREDAPFTGEVLHSEGLGEAISYPLNCAPYAIHGSL